jgi:hypothetical protein
MAVVMRLRGGAGEAHGQHYADTGKMSLSHGLFSFSAMARSGGWTPQEPDNSAPARNFLPARPAALSRQIAQHTKSENHAAGGNKPPSGESPST